MQGLLTVGVGLGITVALVATYASYIFSPLEKLLNTLK